MELLLVCGIILATFHTSHSDMPEFCQQPSMAGTGEQALILTYYNSANDKCYPFIYLGENGNQNRFANERECMRNCSVNAEETYPKEDRKACLFPHLKGSAPCTGNNVRFYYEPHLDICKTFMWKGCFGNGNRFLTEELCNTTCNGVHEEGDADEDDEGADTPVGLICGIVFGVAAGILLIVMIVLLVKSRDTPKKAPKKAKREESPLRERAIEME